MTTYPLVQFVSAPELAAEVRFDFNGYGEWSDEETWPEHEGFSLGVPQLEGDPDGIGVEYGLRELSFNLILSGEKWLATQAMSRLAREILRQRNWLMFQLSADTEPVWFKTYRSQPGDLNFEHVDTDEDGNDLWGIAVSLWADPFAYGARVTLPAATIANDPSAATNPMSYVLPEILGDAPAPLRIDATHASAGRGNLRLMWASATTPAGYTRPHFWNVGAGDSVSAGTDLGAGVTAAGFVGGSYRAVTFATNATLTPARLTQSFNITPLGRYRFLVRVARSDAASSFAFRAKCGYDWGPTVNRSGAGGNLAGYAEWVDLGDFQVPSSLQDPDVTAHGNTSIALHVERLNGTGEARIDALVAVPVEVDSGSSTSLFTTTTLGLSVDPWRFRWDGDGEWTQLYSGVTATPDLWTALEGQFPKAWPGAQNVLHLALQVSPPVGGFSDILTGEKTGSTSTEPDNVGDSVLATVSYHPRYLYLAGS